MVRAALQQPDATRAAVDLGESLVLERDHDGTIGQQLRAVQVTLGIRYEVELVVALEESAVPGVPSVDDLAFHVDEEGSEVLAVVRGQQRESRLDQLALVYGDAAFLS